MRSDSRGTRVKIAVSGLVGCGLRLPRISNSADPIPSLGFLSLFGISFAVISAYLIFPFEISFVLCPPTISSVILMRWRHTLDDLDDPTLLIGYTNEIQPFPQQFSLVILMG